ncbi:MAG: FHA domain-containing protein [Tannerellaceae bacterium]|jgi:pSer/pThr/pTyr-binding forkhead associated (FHA) protein|nr:FHA domain-containing protein [Tannerellaceae bacterium]
MANFRTVVPKGEDRNQAGTVVNRGDRTLEPQAGKPIVGFLVSVSRTEEGEFWVVRQGQNIIGSGSECDIVLSEATVSRVHAVLAVHRNPNDNNRLNIGIMEKGSSNGIFLNGNYIGFNPASCKNQDVLKIGGYELLLFVFDSVELGLKTFEVFKVASLYDYSDRDIYPDSDKTRI